MGMRDEIRSHERTINKALEACGIDASEALASTTEAFRLLDGYRTRVVEMEVELKQVKASVSQLQGYVRRLESLFGAAEVVMRSRTVYGDKRIRDEAIDWLDRRESVHRDDEGVSARWT